MTPPTRPMGGGRFVNEMPQSEQPMGLVGRLENRVPVVEKPMKGKKLTPPARTYGGNKVPPSTGLVGRLENRVPPRGAASGSDRSGLGEAPRTSVEKKHESSNTNQGAD